jgi:fatty-acyl-CoA synthase
LRYDADTGLILDPNRSRHDEEGEMRGLMSDRPLMISTIIEHAARYHGDIEIASRLADRSIHRYTYADAERRSRRLARALLRLGVAPGDRVGTLAWNNYRHFELYYGVSGIGAVCHTINPRLFDEQIVYIVNHAQDRLLFIEAGFVPLVERLRPRLPADCRFVLLEPAETDLPVVATHDDLVAAESEDGFVWPEFDEWTASALCYTSGTTGKPKGVLYTHRSTLLHAYGVSLPDAIPMSSQDSICPVVPMFHACGWGVPYIAPMNGGKLVLPGPHLDGASLYELFEVEGVTISLGVPTVWLGLEAHLAASGARCSTLHRILSGGSAVPPSMIEAFDRHGVAICQGWGMTEMSPVGTTALLKAKHAALADAAKLALRAKQGRPLFGVDMKLVDEQGNELPHDGKSAGELLVRGPWIVGSYYEDCEATAASVEPDGWFHTGDVATIDADGYLQLTDRRKDIIKSGGEWISSIDLENAAMAHSDVGEAAAIAVPNPKWGERPLLIVTPRAGLPPGSGPERDALLAFMAKRFPRWMLPDDVLVVDELPHTATGKVMKTRLRELYGSGFSARS